MIQQSMITRGSLSLLGCLCVNVDHCIMGVCGFVWTIWKKIKLFCFTGTRERDQSLLHLDIVTSREDEDSNSFEKVAADDGSQIESAILNAKEVELQHESTFTNGSWACQACTPDLWLPWDGPLGPELYKVWNVGGMFDYENSNEMEWNGIVGSGHLDRSIYVYLCLRHF